MKNATTSLNEKTIKQLERMFDTTYAGLRMSAESFIVLRRYAKPVLKGIFTKGELKALVDMHNATIFDPSIVMKETLKAEIEDSEKFEGILTKWEVDQKTILNKVDKLPNLHVFFLVLECYLFWYSNKTENKNLDKFIEEFI